MSGDVYANGNEIAHKAGMNKVIAAFPDVCLSPPSPPAGPIPIPYPDTSFSKDLQKGSKNVKIKGKPTALSQQSFYKSSPLGDEAATRSFGANILTHQITGKSYFQMWSMDVIIEGKNACRHLDICTSNHASYPGGTLPMTSAEKMALARIAADECPCCGGSDCPGALSRTFDNGAAREPMSFREYYRLDETDNSGAPTAIAQDRAAQMAANPCGGGACPNAGKPVPKSDPPCDVYRVTTKDEADEAGKDKHWDKAAMRDHHGVPKAKGVFKKMTGTSAPVMGIDKPQWDAMSLVEKNKVLQIDHTTPRAAGGCPRSSQNTQAHGKKCANCKRLDELLDSWNSGELTTRRAALGL